jgi:hypothetical protein
LLNFTTCTTSDPRSGSFWVLRRDASSGLDLIIMQDPGTVAISSALRPSSYIWSKALVIDISADAQLFSLYGGATVVFSDCVFRNVHGWGAARLGKCIGCAVEGRGPFPGLWAEPRDGNVFGKECGIAGLITVTLTGGVCPVMALASLTLDPGATPPAENVGISFDRSGLKLAEFGEAQLLAAEGDFVAIANADATAVARPVSERQARIPVDCAEGAARYAGRLSRVDDFGLGSLAFCFNRCLFSGTSSITSGGAIKVDNKMAQVAVDFCEFMSCSSDECGGGIHFLRASRTELVGSRFVSCRSDGDGGGCVFFGSGGLVDAVPEALLIGVAMSQSAAYNDGGGIVWRCFRPAHIDSNFSECHAAMQCDDSGGGAFACLLRDGAPSELLRLKIIRCGRLVDAGNVRTNGAVRFLPDGGDAPITGVIHDSTWINDGTDCALVIEDWQISLFGCRFIRCPHVFHLGGVTAPAARTASLTRGRCRCRFRAGSSCCRETSSWPQAIQFCLALRVQSRPIARRRRRRPDVRISRERRCRRS